MIKLTYGQIRDPEFNPILNEIVNAKMPLKTARRILGIMKQIQTEQTTSDQLWKVICERYMVPVEESSMMRLKDLGDDEKLDAAQALNEFFDTPVEINEPMITEDEIAHVNLSPLQIAKLTGLIAG